MARIDGVARQVLFHAIDKLAPGLLRLTKGQGSIMLIRVAQSNGNIAQVAPGSGLMANLDFAIESSAVVGEDGVDEIAGMSGAGITGKFADQFTVRIARSAAAPSSGVVAAFAMNHVAAANAFIINATPRFATCFLRRVAANRFVKIRKGEQQGNASGIVVRETNVGRFAGVVPEGPPTGAHNPLWKWHSVAEHNVDDIVQQMNAPVPHFTVAGVPNPMPVVMQLVSIDRLVECWAKPKVIVHALRRLERR